MSRLVWVVVGAAAAVAGARRLGLVSVPDGGLGKVAGGAAGGAAAGARATFRAATTAAGVARALNDARRELREGMAEREQQLRDDLLGDVDVDALRAERAARARAAADEREPAARARSARGRDGWADEPTEDPDDGDGDLPYAFF